MRFKRLVLLTVIVISGCGVDKNKSSNSPKKPSHEKSIFALVTNQSKEGKPLIEKFGIRKSNLDNEYLLRSNVIFGANSPKFSGNKTRIVSFKKVKNEIIMLESTTGHQLYNDLPQDFILAKFPVVEESDSHLYIDLNEGLSKLYLARDWSSSVQPNIVNHYTSVDVNISYLVQNKKIDDAADFIQIAQLNIDGSNLPVKTFFRLEPYQKNKDFIPQELTNFEEVGYFGISPYIDENGTVINYATKYDHSNPIVYGISANTPKDYLDAIKEGILYWNKAFGKEILQVKVVEKGVTAPDYDVNMVQWVDWANSDGAYADLQMDPRTGEVLNSQVFMPSSFAIGGISTAIRFLEDIKHENDKKGKSISFMDETSRPICQYEMDQKFLSKLKSLSGKNVPDNVILKLSQDYVRDVIAHEIGHTLGLRHNFAGSLAATYAPKERKSHINKLILEDKIDKDLQVTSSVMDYLPQIESIISGRQLLSKAHSYDKLAIESLYLGKSIPDDKPLFCTDNHLNTYLDCNRHDYGADIFSVTQKELEESADILAYTLIRGFETSLYSGESINLHAINLPIAEAVDFFVSRRSLYFSLMQKNQKLLSIYRKYSSNSVLWDDDISADHAQLKNDVYSKIEDWSKIMDVFEGDFIVEVGNLFNKKLEQSEILKKQHTETKRIIKNNVLAYLVRFEKSLRTADVNQLFEIKNLEDSHISDEFATYLFEKSKRVLSMSGGFSEVKVKLPSLTEEGIFENLDVKVPTYLYSIESRYQAATLLHGERGEAIDWGIKERSLLFPYFQNLSDEIISDRSLTNISPLEKDKIFARWLLETKEVSGGFYQPFAWLGI